MGDECCLKGVLEMVQWCTHVFSFLCTNPFLLFKLRYRCTLQCGHYGGDPDAVSIVAQSAGGHLAALALLKQVCGVHLWRVPLHLCSKSFCTPCFPLHTPHLYLLKRQRVHAGGAGCRPGRCAGGHALLEPSRPARFRGRQVRLARGWLQVLLGSLPCRCEVACSSRVPCQ